MSCWIIGDRMDDLPAGRWDAQFKVFDVEGDEVVFRANKRIVIVP